MRFLKLFIILTLVMVIITKGYGRLLKEIPLTYWYSEKKDIEFCSAIEWGDTNKMTKIMKEGLDINKRGRNGITFLIYSYIKGNKVSYKFLLENGANPNLFMLLYANFPDGPAGLIFYDSLLTLAVYNDDPYYLELALKHGGNPNLVEPSYYGYKVHILFRAGSNKNLTNVKLLVEAGADVNGGKKEGELGGTPLSQALSLDAYDIAYYLLQKGANPQIDREGIIFGINSFSIARRKIKKEDFVKMNAWERGFITMEQIEWRDKVIEILETNGYKFPDKVKKWNWTNE